MQSNINIARKPKTVDEIIFPTWNRLIEILDLSPDNDWENIADHFPEIFNIFEINTIKQDLKKPGYSASATVLESLRNNLVPIEKLYQCFVSCQSIEACEILEKNYPDETNYNRKKQFASVQPLSNNTRLFENRENQLTNSLNSYQAQTQLTLSQSVFSECINQNTQPTAVLIDIFETILPVIIENKTALIDPIMRPNSSGIKLESTLPVNLRIYGKFEICYISSRNLTFRKKEFFEAYNYLNELKMIKYRHNNLYTAEGILKNSYLPNSYFLLYNYDENYPSKLLSEYANQNISSQAPSQYNIRNQLEILIDISSALAYLHENAEKRTILHGNLQPDNVLVFKNNPQCTAKLVDFTNHIEINENQDEIQTNLKIKDEVARFGMMAFLVATWKYLDKEDCKKIHDEADKYDDKNLFTWDIYCKYKMDKTTHPTVSHQLLRIFFKYTSPAYDDYKNCFKKIPKFLENLYQQADFNRSSN